MTIRRKKPKKMASLFAGIGGFELAFQRVGVTTSLMCEIDPIAQHILSTNIPKAKLVGDICKLSKLPKGTDVLCAGFPCQDLSTIGAKSGLSGTRSSLISEVFRLLKESPVEWVIIENVTNMLHLRGGETINKIVNELEQLGYNWAYRTIDSMAFVPQHRRRVYIVASLHYDPRDVLLSGSYDKEQGVVTIQEFTEPLGFYWTEGKYAIGLYQNGIPTLKCGSTIGIPSSPAIAFPSGEISTPDIRDAERLQGFPADWTKPAEDIARPSSRWKLVGNAVTVDTVSWIANQVIRPEKYDWSKDKELPNGKKWPPAAWGFNGKRYISQSSMYPIERDEISLCDFLQYPCKPLSLKAAMGFEHRLQIGTVRCPIFFKEAISNYVQIKVKENE
jgi:DNA (cytosine-5)-methyltransferase 1